MMLADYSLDILSSRREYTAQIWKVPGVRKPVCHSNGFVVRVRAADASSIMADAGIGSSQSHIREMIQMANRL